MYETAPLTCEEKQSCFSGIYRSGKCIGRTAMKSPVEWGKALGKEQGKGFFGFVCIVFIRMYLCITWVTKK